MEALGIDPKLLLAQLINFALFAYLFKKFLWSSYQKFVTSEKTKLQKLHEIDEEVAKKLAEATENSKKVVDAAQEKAQTLLQSAKNAATQLGEQETIKLTNELARKNKEFISEQEKLESQLRATLVQETVNIASKLAQNALTKSLDEADQERIINKVLGQLKKSHHETQ